MALLQQHHPASPLQHMQHLELQIQQALQQLDESQPGLQHTAPNCHSSTQRIAAAAARSGCAGQGATEHYSTALLRRLLDPSWIDKVRPIYVHIYRSVIALVRLSDCQTTILLISVTCSGAVRLQQLLLRSAVPGTATTQYAAVVCCFMGIVCSPTACRSRKK